MDIVFSSNGDARFNKAIEEYSSIWAWENDNMVRTIEKISGIRFRSTCLLAEVIDGKSQSHPLKLRFDYDFEVKKVALVHEMCHILLKENSLKAKPYKGNLSLGIHMIIDLILFDILIEIWGEEFAKKAVEIESSRSNVYKNAWDWALSLDSTERRGKFISFKNSASKGS